MVQRRVLQCELCRSKEKCRILNVLTDGAVRQFREREFQSLGAATAREMHERHQLIGNVSTMQYQTAHCVSGRSVYCHDFTLADSRTVKLSLAAVHERIKWGVKWRRGQQARVCCLSQSHACTRARVPSAMRITDRSYIITRHIPTPAIYSKLLEADLQKYLRKIPKIIPSLSVVSLS